MGFPEEPKISESAKHLISNILTVNPELRLTLKEILKHFFVAKSKLPKKLPICCLEREQKKEELFPDLYNNNDKENNNINNKIDQHLRRRKLDSTLHVNVIKFFDGYSDKYRVGYILTNGFIGVLFNDLSAMTL